MPHIFERFYRGENVSQLTYPGVGLRLTVIDEIVHRHNGEMEVESKVGEGTAVRLWLPVFEDIPN